jgi:hypothetical protein
MVALAAFAAGTDGGRTLRAAIVQNPTVDVSQLWVQPADISARDLFAGPTAEVAPPQPTTLFTFLEADRSGYSPGYDLRDPDGIEWSVKLGPEAQTEVVVSRILWAIGYHQVPTYYLSTWRMVDGPEGHPGGARFRPALPSHKVVDDWSWYENDFAGTQPFRGLVVVNILLNNWDWKTSNNKIYEVASADGGVKRMYVVRDLGASLGKTDYPRALSWLRLRGLGQGSRNDLEDFEKQRFIKRVEGDRVVFEYRGIHQEIVETIATRDVIWACELLAQLSDAQLNDAFRAGGYAPDKAARYIAKIRAKIAEGLALKRGS